VDRLITTARENLPREIRTMVRGEIQRAVDAIAAALDEISHNLPARIAVGADEQAPATRTHVRLAMDNLAARVIEIRPAYIGKTSPAEIENFAEFIDSLAVLTRHIEKRIADAGVRVALGSYSFCGFGKFGENTIVEAERSAATFSVRLPR
jgi:hypothetical protein